MISFPGYISNVWRESEVTNPHELLYVKYDYIKWCVDLEPNPSLAKSYIETQIKAIS